MALSLSGGIEIFDDAAEKVTDTPEMQSLLERIADDALNEALSRAPDATGEYRASLFVSGRTSGTSTPKAVLASSAWYWHFIEFGTIDQPPQHVLGEAVRAVVEVYVETGKP